MGIGIIYFLLGLLNLAAYFVPKKLSKIEIYATSFFAFSYCISVDDVFDLHYDLYGYIGKGFQWLGFLAMFLIFPSVNILFLNFYPLKRKMKKKIIYIIGWTVFALVFEWICLKTHFFYYNGWKLWYSAICYPIIFLVLLINLKFIRKLLHSHCNREITARN